MEIKFRSFSKLPLIHTDTIESYLYRRHVSDGFMIFMAKYLCKKDTQFAKEMVEYFDDEFVELNKKV